MAPAIPHRSLVGIEPCGAGNLVPGEVVAFDEGDASFSPASPRREPVGRCAVGTTTTAARTWSPRRR